MRHHRSFVLYHAPIHGELMMTPAPMTPRRRDSAPQKRHLLMAQFLLITT